MRVLRGLVAVLLLTGIGMVSTGWSAPRPTVEELFDKVRSVNPGLKDYRAEITIGLRAKAAFLVVPLDLHGLYYYKKPNQYKLALERAPRFVQKYPQMFGWHLPDLKDFHSRLLPDDVIDGHPCYHVELMPRHDMADVVGQELWVNKEDFVFPRQRVLYKDNGEIEINVTYLAKDGYQLFDHMNAVFSFPKISVSATAEANYANYMVNQNLPDTTFQDPR